MNNRGYPVNNGMALRLAPAVGEHPDASTDARLVAAGLFAIVASLDRLTGLFETAFAEDKRDQKAAEAKSKGGAA